MSISIEIKDRCNKMLTDYFDLLPLLIGSVLWDFLEEDYNLLDLYNPPLDDSSAGNVYACLYIQRESIKSHHSKEDNVGSISMGHVAISGASGSLIKQGQIDSAKIMLQKYAKNVNYDAGIHYKTGC